MTPLRWCLVALAFLGAVAAGLLAVRPATVAPPDPFTPTPALPPAQPGAPTPIAAVTAAPPTSAPGLPPPRLPGAAAPAPRVGSEGYGPHIDQAAAGSDAAAAWEAVRWLRQCASNEQRRGSFEAARNQGTAPEMMTQLMVEADAEARRCQTVTAAHRALLPELAARAMRAGVAEAASAYAGAVFPGDLTAAQREEVAAALRRDARSGDAPNLLGALLSHPDWGLSDAERLAFMVAYAELPGQQAQNQALLKSLTDQGLVRFNPPPTAEQWNAARAAARQIVLAAARPEPP